MLQIGFKRLTEDAVLPVKAHETDSGFDLFAAEDVVITPGETKIIKTNITVVLPTGYEAQVRPRSGISSKTDLLVVLGTIDNTYRGDVGIIVKNISQHDGGWNYQLIDGSKYASEEDYTEGTYRINRGERLAQLVVQAIPQVTAVEVFELDETERGDNGFGSTGV